MQTELRQFIGQARFYRAEAERLAELLPAEDAALNAIVAETVQAGDQKAFLLVLAAALSRERHVDARHLLRGAMMLTDHNWMGAVIGRLQGEVPEHLLAAIAQTQLPRTSEAAALLRVAAWCEQRREGKLPEVAMPFQAEQWSGRGLQAEAIGSPANASTWGREGIPSTDSQSRQ